MPTAVPAPFDPSDKENWTGGYYEAAMVVGNVASPQSDAMLRTALERLWSHESLQAFAIGDLSNWRWDKRPAFHDRTLADVHRVYGVFDHQELGPVPFTSVIIREEPDGQDWLYACVPLGGLAQSEGYPLGDKEHTAASRSWREPLERRLAALALAVCEVVPIQIAAIGFEISGIIERDADRVADTPRLLGYVALDHTGYRYWPTTEW
jgi:hypothetical protein